MPSTWRRPPRIALVADILVAVAGSEQVFYYMTQAFPEADVYTLSYNASNTLAEFSGRRIRSHWAGWLFQTHRRFKLLFVLATLLMERWRLRGYDVVLLSSASSAKYLAKVAPRHICYCYYPTRALWRPDEYFDEKRTGLIRTVFDRLLPWMRRRDQVAASKIDRFIAISDTTKTAIREIYNRDSDILFSPIPLEQFRLGRLEQKDDFFLIVSRLEQWKRVDYAIEAFNELGLPLVVIGEGEEKERLAALAGPNIKFLGKVPFDELSRYYGRARAVVFTPAIEYGLVPIEASAAGTPVIALGYGGVRETMVDIEAAQRLGTPATAIFFYEQTATSLIDAVKRFQATAFDRDALTAYAEQFSVEVFQQKLRAMVEADIDC